jgi:hypothetical protein
MWISENQIDEALRLTAYHELPVLRKGAEVLSKLRDWTNQNSDGWPYWQKPSRAADKLMTLIHDAELWRPGAHDITEEQLKAAFRPIKAFLTRQGVDHDLVFVPPPTEKQLAIIEVQRIGHIWKLRDREPDNYENWVQEVRNGETFKGFREWLVTELDNGDTTLQRKETANADTDNPG